MRAFIDPQRWAALSPYLDQALDLPDEQRQSWLAALSATDPEKARDVRALLTRHRQIEDEGFLDDSPLSPPTGAWGQTIGPYTLKAPIGQGGMGTVWLAQRTDGRFERQVAIKFLNIALGVRGDAQFRREGTIVARLQHRHIAQLLDAGVADTGQPYLVLEHVDGERIDDYCESHQLNVFARVELFLEVLAAVAHAHANLIVHRDLKPSNVLVTRVGEVKLLDFGVAKLLENAGESTPLTRDGVAGLTPEYAAPEQINGEPVSTSTDIYSLGVLLFALLAGRHPLDGGRGSPAELIKAIVEDDAPRLSQVVTDARTRRLLRGDLDTIVGKALKKSPAERYASVTAMADDLRRVLRHEPISASADTWRYRAAKFVRRHRGAVAAGVAMFVLLTAGLVTAEYQRRLADSRFRQLRQLADQVFSLDARIRNLPGATAAREALVAASLEYLEGVGADARDDVDLMIEVSTGYLRAARIQGVPTGLTLGNFAKAEESLSKAETLIDAVLASRRRTLEAIELSGQIRHDRMIVADSQGRKSDALVHARGAMERIEQLLADPTATPLQRNRAISLISNIAIAHINLQHYEEGVRYARRHIELADPAMTPMIVSALSVLANGLRLQGDLEGALQTIRQARARAEGATHENETLRMVNHYGLLLREAFILGEDRAVSLDRPEDAIVPLREAFELVDAGARRDASDFLSRSRAATVARELGDILRWRAPEEALTVYAAGLTRLAEIKTSPSTQRDTAFILANSSYALRRLDRVRDARQRVDEALSLLTAAKDYPTDRVALDSEVYVVLMAAADQRAAEGQVAAAAQDYEQLLVKIVAASPQVERDLRQANKLALTYEALVRLHRQAGASARADELEQKRRALWDHWRQRLPGNAFVERRLAGDGVTK
jgi:serine/threonine-protein kinase